MHFNGRDVGRLAEWVLDCIGTLFIMSGTWEMGMLAALRTLSQIITAGVAITAFSLLLYALTFNLRDRVARSFTVILLCVVMVQTTESLANTGGDALEIQFWLALQWAGIIFLPPAYLHFSDAVLATTGKPSRGKRRWLTRLIYGLSALLLVTLPFSGLVGGLAESYQPVPHLMRTWLTDAFSLYYGFIMVLAGYNFVRAYRRTITRTSRRRLVYLLAGATAPALGSYPFLIYGFALANNHPLLFWFVSVFTGLLVGTLVVVMAYAVAFFGVSWSDRVVKARLFTWLLRGPVTASIVLGSSFLERR